MQINPAFWIFGICSFKIIGMGKTSRRTSAIKTGPSGDEDVEILHDWGASENQREHQRDVVSYHKEHAGVNAHSEPAYMR
jgi:hypothetical protein